MKAIFRCGLFALALLAGARAHAQEVDLSNGPELFQAWLKLNGIEPMNHEQFQDGDHRSSSCILVVWGTNPAPDAQVDWVAAAQAVRKSGGAVLIASNEPCNLGVFDDRRSSISIMALPVDPDAESKRVRFSRNLPAPFDALAVAEEPDNFLRAPDPRVIAVERLGGGPFQAGIAATFDGIPRLFAVGGEGPRDNPYRFLVYADQGVLSNEMMIRSRANYQFAWNTVKFLRGPQNRTRCLFLDHGRVVEKFPVEFAMPPLPDVPVPMPNWRHLQTIVADAGNRIMDRLESEDALNRSILGRNPERRERQLAGIFQVLAGIAAVCAVIYMLRKVLKSRQPQDPALTTTRSGVSPSNSVLGRRGQELLRQDNLGELAAAAARDLFRDTGAPDVPGSALPFIEYPHGEPPGLHNQIGDLWRIAHGRGMTSVRAARWKHFEQTLAAVRQAAANGHWRFANPPGAT